MGHKRKLPQPSPLTLLAIFEAKADLGLSFADISQRTGYSVSSLVRWWKRWGFENEPMRRARRGDVRALEAATFSRLYQDLNSPRHTGPAIF